MLRSNDVSSSGAVLLEANPDSFYASAKQPHSAEERLAAYRARFTEETLLAKTAKELESFENEWNEFQTQSAAIEFKTLHQQQQLLHQGGPPLRIFSYEYLPQVPGKRKFIVTNLSSFWKKYSSMEPDQRHFYELISQETPCRIYFDLEFERRINPQISTPHQEEEMMSIFKEFLVSDIKTRFDILHDEANSLLENIVDLDSSTTQKFSRHLVIHIPGAIFENNGAVGHYVRNMCARIEAKILTNGESRQQLSKLFVHAHTPEAHNDDHGQAASKSIFVDLSVYSRNRQFRLYLSSKIGKEAVFLPANTTLLSTNKRKHKNEDHHQKSAQFIPDKELFYKSLVSDSILKPGVRVLADVVSKEEQTRLGSMGVGFGKIIKATSNSNNAVSSPFEEIDNFMLDHIKAVSGYESSSMFFRSASFFPDCKKLAIGILDDEYYNNSLNIS